MRRHHLCLAMIAAITTVSTTASYADFVNDSAVQLKFKNFYLDRQIKDDSSKNWGSWSQGITLDAKSGYHDIGGGVQVGADLLVQHAFKLNGRDQNPDFVLPHDGQKSKDQFGKVGATLKVKVSQTELRIGELLPISPVLTYDPTRQLITTFNGAWLESKDLKDTKLTLAYVDGINNRYDNQFRNLTLFTPGQTLPNNQFGSYDQGPESDGMIIAGVDHQFTPEVSAGYWFADVKDIYQQHYVGAVYKTKLGEKAKLDSHLRYFNTADSGSSLYGHLDNQALSANAKVNYGAHTVGLSYQQMMGDTAFPTLGGWVPGAYLTNWGVATFTLKDEKSVSINYNYDFAAMGVKGLNTTAVYFTGWNAEYKGIKDQDSNELNLVVNYTVPEGKLKGLGFQAMYIDANFDYKSDLQEYRVATTYTYKF